MCQLKLSNGVRISIKDNLCIIVNACGMYGDFILVYFVQKYISVLKRIRPKSVFGQRIFAFELVVVLFSATSTYFPNRER